MSEEVVLYQIFDGQNGLGLEEQVLTAYINGEVKGTVDVAPDEELNQLLLDYKVLNLLPGLNFCHTKPQSFNLEITVDPFALPGEVTGKVVINGDRQLWIAQYQRHPDFLLADQVPKGQRPWADNHPSEGWILLLPASWQTHPDILVPRRLALALECYLDDFAAGRDMPTPYLRQFTNVFSATSPAWRVNLPHIVSLNERVVSELV
jgi:hypothetical protein